MKTLKIKRVVIVILALTMMTNQLKSQTNFIWGKQFGSDKDEYVLNHVIDNNGDVYIAGKTNGIMNGKNYGKNDGFITKIDSSGNTIWTRQFGSDGEEDIQWSAIDNTGCIYITGSTTGVLNSKYFGREDIFIVKYNPLGEMEWEKQFGTDSTDIAKGIYADNKGYIYVTGMTGGKLGKNSFGKTDCFIMKLDNMGNHLFTSQFGTPGDDYSYAITGGPDSDIFICGTTWGDIAGKNKGIIDGFTGHFTDRGDLIRYNQFGSEGFDIAMIINVDNEKNIYIGGTTTGNFGCQQIGEGDGFLLKISEKGDILWNNQFGTKNNDGVRSIDFNSKISDNILVSGILNLPPAQGFIRMYKKDGALLWERNFIGKGKNLATSGKDAGFDNKGNFYHMGLTGANLFGTLIGEVDVYLVKMGLDSSFLKH
ncbi:MAG: SBBP repeat-containing protein [Bacteroidales bacterium]